jgi:hypothetical protein
MVVEDFLNFSEWFPAAITTFLLLTAALTVLGVFFGYLVAAFRHGPGEGFYIVAQTIGGAFPDALGTSPRRVFAIAKLAAIEAIRRRVVIVTFAVFGLALLLGGWFMNTASDHPEQIYLNFVLWGTQLLVLMTGLLMTAFSLPDDIKNKTIYTVVTKPVRATEIVFGRIVGFAAVGTVLIAVMGFLSFLFVWRGLSHNHRIVGETQTIASLTAIDPVQRLNRYGQRVSDSAIKTGETTIESGHRHIIELIEDIREKNSPPLDERNVVSKTELPDGRIRYERLIVEPIGGHSHTIIVNGEGPNATFTVGKSDGYFRARVPIYASSLSFFDSTGELKDKGTDIGKEWNHRGYIDGGTNFNRNSLAKAEFVYENIRPEFFSTPDLLVLELDLGVFRTTKGDIEKRVTGSLQFESVPDNPEVEPKFRSDRLAFETDEYNVQMLPFKTKLLGETLKPDGSLMAKGELDFFKDFAKNGKVRVILRCEDQNQYLGAARENVYFRASDSLYWMNFTKGFLGIWAQMLIIVSIGVAFSTFLSAPVTVVGAMVMLIIGFNSDFIRNMVNPEVSGGGPIESFYRIVTQKNMEVELEPGLATSMLEQSDYLLVSMLGSLTNVAPNFTDLNFSDFLLYGYSVDIHRLSAAIAISLSFCIGLTVFGYFCLKTREIAK